MKIAATEKASGVVNSPFTKKAKCYRLVSLFPRKEGTGIQELAPQSVPRMPVLCLHP